MTARIITGTLASVIAAILQAPRGMTVREWIEHTRRKAKGDK